MTRISYKNGFPNEFNDLGYDSNVIGVLCSGSTGLVCRNCRNCGRFCLIVVNCPVYSRFFGKKEMIEPLKPLKSLEYRNNWVG